MLFDIKKLFWHYFFKINCRYNAIKHIKKVCLGNKVLHKGKVREIINGSIPTMWTLSDPYEEYVYRTECKPIENIHEWFHRYNYSVTFFEGYWLFSHNILC